MPNALRSTELPERRVAAPPPSDGFFPHIDLLLKALRIHRDRLSSASKVAIDVRLLRLLMEPAIRSLPFSVEFYRREYPDVDGAMRAGTVTDPHRHFVESGYFEGRLGAPPVVDEAFYLKTYPDVAMAIRRGEVETATQHYIRAGAAEGRLPSAAARPSVERWMALLRDDPARG